MFLFVAIAIAATSHFLSASRATAVPSTPLPPVAQAESEPSDTTHHAPPDTTRPAPADTTRPAPADTTLHARPDTTPEARPSVAPDTLTAADLASRWDIRIFGADDRDEFGVSLASGDWNGDSVDDLAVGAWLADSYDEDRKNAGEVYIFFGGAVTHKTGSGNGLRSTKILYGSRQGERAGTSVASGDWDADGIADLAIGARFAGLPGDTLSRQGGSVTILYGGAPAESSRDILDLAAVADVVLLGQDEGDRFGQTLHFADLDDDGYDDLLIAAVDGDAHKNNRRDAGEVYCLFGRPWKDDPKVFDLIDFPDWRIDGVDPNDGLGRCIASADIDGDGRLDLVLSANFADGSENAKTNAGETYIVFGGTREELMSKTDLARHADCVLYGSRAYENSGVGLAVGDLDDDGRAEIAIGADLADDDAAERARSGVVYILRGRDRSGYKRRAEVSREVDLTFAGKLEDEHIGRNLLMLSWGGTSALDLAVAANLASAGTPLRERAGRVFLVLGRRDLFATPGQRLILDDTADRLIDGGGAKDQCGYALGRASIPSQTEEHLLIGAPFADGPRDERGDAGEIYVIGSDAPSPSRPAP
jgi:hypothetical protein